ncbi:helix-turn-helix domain-containing protein [Clavibacter michiganensis]|uniref:helix-turn-helix domain-containing protein n=1 Tax=Clavibacter michiganensis TaxID=28447 RepID=UPI001F45E371|nr:helix-turn-helix transcriptional regulator [Clavibacter michiganensis]
MRRARVARGLSQGEFAAACGLSRSYVSALEHGRENPTLETVARVARALGLRSSDLIRKAEDFD